MAYMSHSILCLVFFSITISPVCMQRCSRADITLLLDTSSSVFQAWRDPSGLQQFIREFILSLPISEADTRMGLGIFADGAAVIWDLASFFDRRQMADQVPTIYFRNNDETYIEEALNRARTQMFRRIKGDRDDAPNVIVVLTDGTNFFNESAIRREVNALRRDGVTIYAIGWGPVSETDLLTITGGAAANIYKAETYQDIVDDFPRIFPLICGDATIPPPTEPTTPRPYVPPSPADCTRADIAFMLDTSTSVAPFWPGVQQFVNRFVDKLNIGQDYARVSGSVFADGSLVSFFLSSFYDKAQIRSAVQALYFRNATESQYEFALNDARTLQFIARNGDRADVPNVAIMITDGAVGASEEVVKVEAEGLRRANTEIFVIGWGNLDLDLATAITGDPRKVFYTRSAQDLFTNFDTAFNAVCTVGPIPPSTARPPQTAAPGPGPGPGPGPVPLPPRPTGTPQGPPPTAFPRPRPDLNTDILFLVDSSGSVAGNNFAQLQDFLAQLIQRILSTYDARTALVLFSSEAQTAWDFNRYANSPVPQVTSAVYSLRNLGGATYKSTPFRLYLDQLNSGKGGNRPNVRDIIIFITDGQTVFEDRSVLYDVLPSVLSQAIVLGIGIGPIDLDEMERIVTPPAALNNYLVNDFASLTASVPGVMTALQRSLDFTNELPPLTQSPIDQPPPPFPVTPSPNTPQPATPQPTPAPTPGTFRPPAPVPAPVPPSEECKADILFLVDSSGSIRDAGANNYDLLKNFISNVILGLPIGKDRVQVALGIFSSDARLEWDYNEYFNAPDLTKAVGDLFFIGAETFTSKAFQLYLDFLENAGGNRVGVNDIIILITDGNTTAEDRSDLNRVLEKVKRSATILGVGIGDIDLKEMELIVSPPLDRNYVGAENFIGLISVLDRVISITGCPSQASTTLRPPVNPVTPPPATRAPPPPFTQAPPPPPPPFTQAPLPLPPPVPTPIPPETNDPTLAVFTYSVDNTVGSQGPFPFDYAEDFSDKFNIAKKELVIPVDGLYYFSMSAGAPANITVDYSLSFNSLNLKPAVRRSHNTGRGADTIYRDVMLLLARDTEITATSQNDLYSDAFKMTSLSAFSVSDTMLDPKYFYVYRRSGSTNSTKVEFPDILLNNQGDYIMRSNEYRCPTTAIYIFTFSVFVPTSQRINARLKVGFDAYELVRNHTKEGDSGGDVLSRTVMALCYTDMSVSVELDEGVIMGGPDLTTGLMGFSYRPDFARTREVYWSLRRNTEYINRNEGVVDLPFTIQDQPGYPFAGEDGGVFTAIRCPYSGWYYVHISAATLPNYPLNLFITVDDERQVAVFRASRWHNGGMDYIGRSAILKCREGNDMKVQIGGYTAVGNTFSSEPNVRGTSFLGFMIYSDDTV